MFNPAKTYKKIFVSGDTNELNRIRDFVIENALLFGFSEDQSFKICLAVDEACSNLIRHSFKFDTTKEICIAIEESKEKFTINIIDKGVAFNPLDYDTPDMVEYLKKFKKGGLGIHIIRSVMDEISYLPAMDNNTTNTLMLTKYKIN
jgi:serine/threonine-protein kinase RsbW